MFRTTLYFLTIVSAYTADFQFTKIEKVPDLSFMPQVYSGLDVLEQMDLKPLLGKKVAVLCNQTSVNRHGKHILDILKDNADITISIIFTPQYGLFGDQENKTKLLGKVEKDPNTQARIVNLLDRFVKPPEWTLREADIVLIDIQDTGVRYTTYMTTITKILEVAGEMRKPVIVLDRPNPIRGDRMDGPIVRPEYQSFEGYHLVPIRHGLTIGEYVLMINEMGWVNELIRADLTIIPMANWQRSAWSDKLKLKFIPIAPGIKDVESCLAFAGMNLLTGTNLNWGQGTARPYFRAGAPWISGDVFYDKIVALNLPGVKFRHIRYTPNIANIDGSIPLYFEEECSGVEFEIIDRNLFDPLATATAVIILAYQLHPRQFQWVHDQYIDKLFGYNLLTTFAAQGKAPQYLPPQWTKDVLRFSEFRNRFLLYP